MKQVLATPAQGLALSARVGFGRGEAEGFEFTDEFAEPTVVAEPGLVVGELLVGQDADGGLAVSHWCRPISYGLAERKDSELGAGIAGRFRPLDTERTGGTR